MAEAIQQGWHVVGKHLLALAGGVGGAKLAYGLTRVLPPEALTIVVNTGDDEEFYGLHVSPDLDTVMYTLSERSNEATGWGLKDESFRVLESLGELGAETWFGLGDRDLATHLRRTQLLREGWTLSEVTAELCRRFGLRHSLVPMTDARVRTVVRSDEGTMSFQEYFVKRRCEPVIEELTYEGAAGNAPSKGFAEAIERADAVVLCPSNPFLSIAPILALAGVRQRLASRRPLCVVSPIISGEAVKGPAAKLFQELAKEPASSVAVARHYLGLATHFVLDQRDASLEPDVRALGYETSVQQTLMTKPEDRIDLARNVCAVLGIA